MPTPTATGTISFAALGARIGHSQSGIGAPIGSDVEYFPGRLYNWQATPIDERLRDAIQTDPGGMVGCVSAFISGRRLRWSTRSIVIPSTKVHGGKLWFEGRLVGDGEYAFSVNLAERSFDTPSFSIEVDNSLRLGIDAQSEAGSAGVRPLTGAFAEVAIAHPSADWDARYVVIRGTIAGASYGGDGRTLNFSIVPFWKSLDARVIPTITPERWPGAPEANLNKSIPIFFGTGKQGKHRLIRVNDGLNYYLLNGALLNSNNPASVVDSAGISQSMGSVFRLKDGLGRWVEAIEGLAGSALTDDELFAEITGAGNGWFDYNGGPGTLLNNRARGLAFAIMYCLARYAPIDGADVDFSGFLEHAYTRLAYYAISLDAETSVRELLIDRLTREVAGFFTIRRGRLAFKVLPNFDIYGHVQPKVAARLHFGTDLLSYTDPTESTIDDLRTVLRAEWDYLAREPLTGEAKYNSDAANTTDLTSESSYWLRVGEGLHGKSGTESFEYPDLVHWRDCRGAMRFEEIVRSRVLREIDYTATAKSSLGVYPGDFVEVTHEENGYDRKLFFVGNVGVTLRPVVRLGLIEWPRVEDTFGAFGGVNLTEV